MKVAMFVHTLDDRAVSRVVCRIGERMSRYGMNVVVLAAVRGPGAEEIVPSGMRVVDLGMGGRRSLLGARRLAAAMKRESFDVLFAHGGGPIRAAVTARVLAKSPVRLVGVEHVDRSSLPTKARRLRDAVSSVAYPRLDLVAGVSPRVVAELSERFRLYPPRVIVLPSPGPARDEASGLWSDHRDPAWPDEDRPERVVCCVANVIPRKGQDLLVEALPSIRLSCGDVGLLLIGREDDPQFSARLRARAESLGIGDRVAFAGYVPKPLPLVARSHVMMMPSRAEGLGMALIEGMACGVPVVACEGAAGPEYLLADGAGILVPAEDPSALARAAAAALDDHEVRKGLIAGGLERAAQFEPDVIAARYRDVAYALVRLPARRRLAA